MEQYTKFKANKVLKKKKKKELFLSVPPSFNHCNGRQKDEFDGLQKENL